MTIIRDKYHPNEILKNKNLSLRAKGLAMMLLSGDSFFPFDSIEIAKRCCENHIDIRFAFDELVDFGLINENGCMCDKNNDLFE